MNDRITAPPPPLPARDPRGHKGTFGTVAIIGGCAADHPSTHTAQTRMIGGPALAALAALRTGAGLARLVMPAPILDAALTTAPEATGLALPVDNTQQVIGHEAAAVVDQLLPTAHGILIGPGLGAPDDAPGVQAAVVRTVGQEAVPVVVDADAINALATMPDIHRDIRASMIITPHVGEFKRLTSALGMHASDVTASIDAQCEGACSLAAFLGCVVVLKSNATVVADAVRAWAHDQPNSALATAGSGDVLAGVIAGLVAQHAPRVPAILRRADDIGPTLFDLARTGVLVHAQAGATWAASNHASGGLLARDLLNHIPQAIESLRTP
ncbi:MAG: NAD(P)H-hydrate dehydratase [Phycisphaerales bacterium]|nr:NAD(P)H-hydrate dehydratase [Phycisphaerales bacterium]